MNRHHNTRPTAPPTRGEDLLRPACEGSWHLVDAMFAHKPDTRYHRAARGELARLCSGCDVRSCKERVE